MPGGSRCANGVASVRDGRAPLRVPITQDDRIAIADVVVQQPQQCVGTRLVAEAALHPQLQVARLQVVRDGVARRAELARHRREEDAELRRHRPLPVQDQRFDRKPASNATPAATAIPAPRSRRMFMVRIRVPSGRLRSPCSLPQTAFFVPQSPPSRRVGKWVTTTFSSSASTSGAVKFFGRGPRGLPDWPFLKRLCTVGLPRST